MEMVDQFLVLNVLILGLCKKTLYNVPRDLKTILKAFSTAETYYWLLFTSELITEFNQFKLKKKN